MVQNLEWFAGEHLIARVVGADIDVQPPAAIQQPEAHAGERLRQARREGQRVP